MSQDIPIVGRPKAVEHSPPPLRILIAVPAHDNVPAKFAQSLAGMAALTGASLVADGIADVRTRFYFGTYIDKSREELAATALRYGCTHILYLDSDMRFPSNLLIRLLNHNLPIVGINYAGRRLPTRYIAIKNIDEGVPLVTNEESTGLEEVEAIGFGAVLIQTRVFQNLTSRPFFNRYWNEDEKRWVGEDVHFCRIARDDGYRVFVDHDLSKECGHLGSFEYLLEHVEAQEEVNGDH